MPRLSVFLSYSFTLFWSLILVPNANATKVTIDDTDPDIHYINEFVLGSECDYCWAHPDPAQAYGGTWHDAYKPSDSTVDGAQMFNYTFRGTGIAIYAIVAHGAPRSWSSYSAGMIWDIDKNVSASWNFPVETPTDPPTYTYNVMVASRNDLSDGLHTLRVYLGHNQPSFLFDYLVVTNSDPEPTSSTSSTSTAVSSSTTANSTLPSSSTTATNSTSLQTIPSFTLTTSSIAGATVINAPVGSNASNNNATTEVSKRLSTAAAIGIAAGAVSLCVLLLFLLFLWRKRRQEKNDQFVSEPTPFDIGNDPGMSMVAPFVPIEGPSDSHRAFQDIKAPLPIGDSLADQQQQSMYERHKPDLPSHDGFVNYSHPYGPAYHWQQQQQAMGDEISDGRNDNQRAPWFQQTEGSHPVEALQQHAPSSSPPNSPLNPYPDQKYGNAQ
ncbi:hypothetical protein CPB86DRAFT_362622 [Serendipita vermifera]|nr:hypothetical protein CPB86DRAFT_362622 [Serendipita vermifera]